MDIYLGLVLVITILVAKWGIGRWRAHRLFGWWNRGHAALESGDMVTAEVAFRECVRLAPIWGVARRMLGMVLARRHKSKEAEEQLRMGTELEPRNSSGHLELAFFLSTFGTDRAQDTADSLAKALECDPNLRNTLREAPYYHVLRRMEPVRRVVEDDGAQPSAQR